jgi:glycerol-3-phosphate cytidylyltransferase
VKTIITYGTYDLFHYGHLRLLQRAKALGDRLVVFVSTDDFNKLKSKDSIIPYHERKAIIESLKCVDLVLPEISWEQKKNDIKLFDDEVLLVMGDDWKGKFDTLSCKVTYLPRTEDISSTRIKRRIKQ